MPKGRGGGFALAPDFTIHAPIGYLWKPCTFTPTGVPIYEAADIAETPGAVDDGFPFYSSGATRFCGEDGNFYHLFRRNPASRPAGKGFWSGRSSEHVIASFDAAWKPRWFVGRKAIGAAGPGEVYYPYRNNGMMADCLFVSDMEGVVHLIHRDGFFVTTILQDPYRKTVPGPDLLQVENFSGSVMEDPKTGAKRLYISSHQATHVFEISGLESFKTLAPVPLAISGPQLPAFASQTAPGECLIRRTMGARPAEKGFLPVQGIDWRRDAFPLLIQRDGRPAAEIRMLYDDQNLYVLADLLTEQRFEAVEIPKEQPKKTSRNAPKPDPDLTSVRRFGAAIELLVGIDPQADPGRSAPMTGDQRFVAIQLSDDRFSGVLRQRQRHGPLPAGGKPGDADRNQPHTYVGPAARLAFDDVRFLGDGQKVQIDRELPLQRNGQIVYFKIPWLHILLPGQSLKDLKGKRLRFDAGVIWPGTQPSVTYWQGRNPAMRLTGDPAVDEALTPDGWGWFRLDENLPAAADDTALAGMTEKPIRIDGRSQDWEAFTEENPIIGDTGYVARFRTAWDEDNFYASAQVSDDSPLLNAASDPRVLFKGGDMIAFCFGAGDSAVKVAMTSFKDKPVVVLYRPKSASKMPYDFISPVGRFAMDEVRQITIPVSFLRKTTGWWMECAIPWTTIGLDPQPGQSIPFDVQVNSSDPAGQTNARVSWWHARSAACCANLDIPTEARLYPAEWGNLILGRPE
ncbi:MAG: hypothetical protein J0M02_00200 [Planctomycetes bacterium]|nr:hypothetical protein [Planctomycetota bacterium]